MQVLLAPPGRWHDPHAQECFTLWPRNAAQLLWEYVPRILQGLPRLTDRDVAAPFGRAAFANAVWFFDNYWPTLCAGIWRIVNAPAHRWPPTLNPPLRLFPRKDPDTRYAALALNAIDAARRAVLGERRARSPVPELTIEGPERARHPDEDADATADLDRQHARRHEQEWWGEAGRRIQELAPAARKGLRALGTVRQEDALAWSRGLEAEVLAVEAVVASRPAVPHPAGSPHGVPVAVNCGPMPPPHPAIPPGGDHAAPAIDETLLVRIKGLPIPEDCKEPLAAASRLVLADVRRFAAAAARLEAELAALPAPQPPPPGPDEAAEADEPPPLLVDQIGQVLRGVAAATPAAVPPSEFDAWADRVLLLAALAAYPGDLSALGRCGAIPWEHQPARASQGRDPQGLVGTEPGRAWILFDLNYKPHDDVTDGEPRSFHVNGQAQEVVKGRPSVLRRFVGLLTPVLEERTGRLPVGTPSGREAEAPTATNAEGVKIRPLYGAAASGTANVVPPKLDVSLATAAPAAANLTIAADDELISPSEQARMIGLPLKTASDYSRLRTIRKKGVDFGVELQGRKVKGCGNRIFVRRKAWRILVNLFLLATAHIRIPQAAVIAFAKAKRPHNPTGKKVSYFCKRCGKTTRTETEFPTCPTPDCGGTNTLHPLTKISP